MAIDLSGLTTKELEKLKADVEKALTASKARDLRAAKKAAEKAAAQFGFSLTELADESDAGAAPKRKYKKRKVAKDKGIAKYRNPENADQTWTGKGRQPNWFRSAMEKGIDPAALEI
ncbi:H-NS histone family protein [Aestuariivita sp.]|jgi:DNA-binding protein H-NS|uniref:H-NS histone family protein n=1 Tax=Aestuariivita sp. TaxID=1872407 RepID=UPI00216E557E|nr:H-NS histone family protein [Aestuariivita sp.]MCE8007619.1 H-NS histone family protein [Aestuariivita sp.]|eukprot:TRINITY_DN88092_c0_g1_i1.p2 TRINITY_DN88092_c0_g1~~TRINITY_DN88092_c0_g1_i1.p2  ORF type:complete len:117 (+),score=14.04 TRINITY_DN88092_c0_g1_i1:76-426(+)